MSKKVAGILFVCIVIVVAIAIAVIASVATKPGKEEVEAQVQEKEDFFCCMDLNTKLLRSQVEIKDKISIHIHLQEHTKTLKQRWGIFITT